MSVRSSIRTVPSFSRAVPKVGQALVHVQYLNVSITGTYPRDEKLNDILLLCYGESSEKRTPLVTEILTSAFGEIRGYLEVSVIGGFGVFFFRHDLLPLKLYCGRMEKSAVAEPMAYVKQYSYNKRKL